MKTTIDGAGRVVVPKALRGRLGLLGGRGVDIREREGRLEAEPAPTPMTLVRRGRVRVAVPARKLPALTDETVRTPSNSCVGDHGRHQRVAAFASWHDGHRSVGAMLLARDRRTVSTYERLALRHELIG